MSSATHFMLALAAQARNLPSLPNAAKATTVAFMGSKYAHDGLRGNPVDGRFEMDPDVIVVGEQDVHWSPF